jgi:hypothetical protein
VTGFFRHPEAFAAIQPVIADIVSGKDADDQIRVWVPACATGEEAYSIATLLAEAAPDRRGAQASNFCNGHRRARDRDGESGALPQIAARRPQRRAAPAMVRQRERALLSGQE